MIKINLKAIHYMIINLVEDQGPAFVFFAAIGLMATLGGKIILGIVALVLGLGPIIYHRVSTPFFGYCYAEEIRDKIS